MVGWNLCKGQNDRCQECHQTAPKMWKYFSKATTWILCYCEACAERLSA